MLQNRQNQIAAVQIAARRNLDQVALVAGTPHLLSMPKHRLYWSKYGKRPTSPTQPQFDSWCQNDSQDQLGSGSDSEQCHRSRLQTSAASSVVVLGGSERQRAMSSQVVGQRVSQPGTSIPTVATSVWRIPATAWAAFAIQQAIRG